MARAIFLRNFNFSSRRRNAGWAVKASPQPQIFPQELIDAALARETVAILPPVRGRPHKKSTAERPTHEDAPASCAEDAPIALGQGSERETPQ